MFIVKIDSQADRTLSYSEFLKSDFSLVPPSIRHYLTVPCSDLRFISKNEANEASYLNILCWCTSLSVLEYK